MANDPTTKPEYLRVRNWENYQIYHDGRPMKFFAIQATDDVKKGRRGILSNPGFLRLIDRPDCPVIRIMALAARDNNKIPNDAGYLKQVLLCSEDVNIEAMVSAQFLEPHPDYLAQPLVRTAFDVSSTENSVLPSRSGSLSVSVSSEEKLQALGELQDSLRSKDSNTDAKLKKLSDVLPTAAFRSAIEELEVRRRNTEISPLRNEGRYILYILDKWIGEKRYAA